MLNMMREILRESWTALARSRTRSLLTSARHRLGHCRGHVADCLWSGLRTVLVSAFNAFGKSTVVAWPAQTSEQPGGQRAGKKVKFELADLEAVRGEANMVKHACLEAVKFLPIAFGDRLVNTATRGVCPEYGEMRNENAVEGRWLKFQRRTRTPPRGLSRLSR